MMGEPMKTATVGEVQKNFARVLKSLRNGEEITITKRGKPIAKVVSLSPKDQIEWPDFQLEAVKLRGKQMSDIILEGRNDRK